MLRVLIERPPTVDEDVGRSKAYYTAVAHSGVALLFASAAALKAGSASFGSNRFMKLTRYGPVSHGCTSA